MNAMLPKALTSCKYFISHSRCLLEAGKLLNGCSLNQVRTHMPLRIKYPLWFCQKERADYCENLTKKNREFLQDVVEDTFGPKTIIHGNPTYDLKSPLANQPFVRGTWDIKSQRCGLLGRKIGVYPLWSQKGERIVTTLVQVSDVHVIKYIPPEEFEPKIARYKCIGHKKNLGCILLGSESTDPQKFTKEYCGLFMKHGMMPKRRLARFLVTPNAAIQPGTPMYATHFKVGQRVDVRGLTIQRGFQGVMKRWGFSGQPATHGQTKTHRRPGCIGMGRKRKVQRGKKLPGHMGYRWRTTRSLEVLRINTKYNVLYLKGRGIPGETGSYVYIYDTKCYAKRFNHHNQPVFPTFYPEDLKEPLPEDLYAPGVFDFSQPSIMYEIPKETKKRR